MRRAHLSIFRSSSFLDHSVPWDSCTADQVPVTTWLRNMRRDPGLDDLQQSSGFGQSRCQSTSQADLEPPSDQPCCPGPSNNSSVVSSSHTHPGSCHTHRANSHLCPCRRVVTRLSPPRKSTFPAFSAPPGHL